jgi:hypothetical protein
MSLPRLRRRLAVLAASLLAVALAATALAAAGDLGAQQRISVTGPDGNVNFASFRPAVAYNPDRNEYLAVWSGETATDDEFELFGRLLEPGGEPIGGQFRISSMGPEGNANYSPFFPSVVYNPVAKEYLVAWHGDDNTPALVDEEFEIYVQRLSATGAEVGVDDQRISAMGPEGSATYGGFNTSVAYNPSANEYLIAWNGDDNTPPLVDNELEIFVQRLSATGAEQGIDDQRISTLGPDGNPAYRAFNPSVVYNSTEDEYLIAWNGDDNTPPLVDNEREVFVQRLSVTGAEVGTDDQRISSMGPDGDPSYGVFTAATATYNSTANEYLIAWDSDDNTAPLIDNEIEIFAQRLSATGAEVGTDDQRISTMGPDGSANYNAADPTATYDPTANEYLIAWEGDDNTAPLVDNEIEIFAQRLSATGAEQGADDQRISTMGPDGNAAYHAQQASVAYNSTANEYLIAWDGDDNTPPLVDNKFEIFARGVTGADPPVVAPPPPTDAALDGGTVDLAKKLPVRGSELKIKLAAGCAEDCSSTASGSVVDKAAKKRDAKTRKFALKPAAGASSAGQKATLTLKLKGSKGKRRKLTAKIVDAINRGDKLTASVAVELSDPSGNAATVSATARLKAKAGKPR